MWKKKVVFWTIRILTTPIVYIFFTMSDILNRRFYNPTAEIKTKMVFQKVKEEIGVIKKA
jgi:hypothetical protein